MDEQPVIAASSPATPFERRLWHWLIVAGLFAICVTIALPFLSAVIWAIILAVSAWPWFISLRRALGDRPRLAASLFFAAGIMLLFVPLILAGASVVRHAPAVMQGFERVEQFGLPGPPDQVARLPLVGPKLHDAWAGLSRQGSEVLAQYRSQINATAGWLLRRASTLGMTILQFGLAILMSALLLARSDRAIGLLCAFGTRIGGDQALGLLALAAQTIRAVSFGVVGTSLVEAILSATGFAISGSGLAVLLGSATFLLCLLQVGPGFVFVPAAAWMWWRGDTGWAVFVLLWHLVLVLPIELFGRPYFISRGTGLPMLLIFVGVLGGMLAFGFIGIFVGATVLAVSYRLALRWLANAP